MGSIGPSVFLARDIIRHLIPTLVATALFFPLSPGSKSIGVEGLATIAIVSAYFVTAFAGQAMSVGAIDHLMSTLYLPLEEKDSNGKPIKEPTAKEIKDTHQWWGGNWDYERLFFSLDKDDREYVYMTDAYLTCFDLLSFFFFLYLAFNFTWLFGRIYTDVSSNVFSLFDIRTPLLYGSAPTVLVVLFSYLLFNTMASWARTEELALFWDGGIYPQFSAKQQRKDGGLAKAVWGWVRRSEEAVQGASVHLFCNGVEIGVKTSDKDGRFQFPVDPQELLDNDCALEVRGHQSRLSFKVDEKSVPEYSLDLSRADFSRST